MFLAEVFLLNFLLKYFGSKFWAGIQIEVFAEVAGIQIEVFAEVA